MSRFSAWPVPPKLTSSYKVNDLAETTDASSAATKVVSCIMGRRVLEIIENENEDLGIGGCIFEGRQAELVPKMLRE